MILDRNGYALTTNREAAEAYNSGLDKLLSANAGAEKDFGRALTADPDYAPAYAALARHHQIYGDRARAKAAIAAAREKAPSFSGREASLVACLAFVLDGKGAEALAAIQAHMKDFPRDALALSPVCGVFGIYGFSGRAGRDQELRAYLDTLETGFGEDWWFLVQHGFARIETGGVARGAAKVDRALALFPREANGAHIRAHAHYELGEARAGYAALTEWLKPYPRDALMYCHLDWHRALWALDLGKADDAWAIYRANVAPGAIWGPSLNVATDAASFLLRAEFAGAKRDTGEWKRVTDYIRAEFPRAGIAFVDTHALMASAMAGDDEAFIERKSGLRGPAVDMVAGLGEAFRSYAKADYASAATSLAPLLPAHERIGGSRAQRDMLEVLYIQALRHAGRAADAQAYAKTRRR
jgi:predicted Zn-dependent protease